MERGESTDHHFDATMAAVSVSLLASVPATINGIMSTLYSGGIEGVIRATSEVALNILTLNLHEAALAYTTYPNEMSATFSFMIAGLCGFVALGGAINHASHEAQNTNPD